jgi:hypothetical protein
MKNMEVLMFKKTFKWMLSIVLALFLGISGTTLALSPVMASSPVGQEHDFALLRDAQTYANCFSVSLDEALNRFHLIDISRPFHLELLSNESNTFGEGWIDNGAKFKFVLQFTNNGQQTIQPYLAKYSELAPYIEIRMASISYKDLLEEQAKVVKDIESIGVKVEHESDVKSGRIHIYLVEYLTVVNAIKQGLISLPGNVDLIPVDHFGVLCDVIGGHGISAAGQNATTGFGALDGTDRVITTAGHFADDTNRVDASYDGLVSLDYYSDIYGTRDLAWYQPASGVTNKVRDTDSSTRSITSVQSVGGMWVDEGVFGYGIVSHQMVAKITNLSYLTYYVRTTSLIDEAICEDGDSGAPIYRANAAFGSLVGIPPGAPHDMYFYPAASFPNDAGITVLTSP